MARTTIGTFTWAPNIQRIFDALPGDDHRRAFWFLLATGCRFSEMARMRAPDCAGPAIHFRASANQARFVLARRAAMKAGDSGREPHRQEMERILRDEIALARRLHAIQSRDSRIGFEASNQYYYVPVDLMEKVINCRHLLDQFVRMP